MKISRAGTRRQPVQRRAASDARYQSPGTSRSATSQTMPAWAAKPRQLPTSVTLDHSRGVPQGPSRVTE